MIEIVKYVKSSEKNKYENLVTLHKNFNTF